MGGDGATYDIGFGALSRLLSTSTPIKVVVLNTGAYSNTGGQASTASLTGQDFDLSRFGAAHSGKQEERKELALIAAFHPNVFVVQSCAGMQAHFLKHVVELDRSTRSPPGRRRAARQRRTARPAESTARRASGNCPDARRRSDLHYARHPDMQALNVNSIKSSLMSARVLAMCI